MLLCAGCEGVQVWYSVVMSGAESAYVLVFCEAHFKHSRVALAVGAVLPLIAVCVPFAFSTL